MTLLKVEFLLLECLIIPLPEGLGVLKLSVEEIPVKGRLQGVGE